MPADDQERNGMNICDGLRLARDGDIAIITFDRPEKMNALSVAMRDGLAAAFISLDADDSVRAIVLTGAGDRAFCAGQDLSESQNFTADKAGEWALGWKHFYDAMHGLSKPLVAAVNGIAAGGGFQIALLVDVAVAHPGVKIGQTEINSGIVSTYGPWIIAERAGISRARDLTLTGRLLDAEEAREIGLIARVVPADRVMAEAMEVARLMAGKPPVAMKYTKKYFAELIRDRLQSAYEAGVEFQQLAFGSGEPQEMMRRFLAARKK